jgi:fructuronate reductase
MTRPRLNGLWLASARRAADLAPGLVLPHYRPDAHGAGIVHLGPGAFHRAHQAVYTDEVLARQGGDWRTTEISLRSTTIVDDLAAQDGLYTVLVRDGQATRARVIGSIAAAIAASRNPQAAMAVLASPQTRVVTVTVTEKAYGIDRATRQVQPDHPAIAHDLVHPDSPTGVIGLLLWAIRQRRSRGVTPFTVLCCDNLPSNGKLLQAGVCDMAQRQDPALASWISTQVPFPCSMVDRITPASTAQTLADAALATGCEDLAAVETEPFSMWVMEDNFSMGRPAWEDAGALMVDDVAPYEHMKLRMLNGAHSLLAYAGHVAGYQYVRDAMSDAHLAQAADRHMRAAAGTLQPLAGVDFSDYAAELHARFANPAIAHECWQIAMDGTEKLPQRILQAALDCMAAGGDARPFAFATAAWMRYCLGVTDAGNRYALRDPREAEIVLAIQGNERDARALCACLMALPGLFPDMLRGSAVWCAAVSDYLQIMLAQGMRAALDAPFMSGPNCPTSRLASRSD